MTQSQSQVNGYAIYTTREGDSFDALALAAYGDEFKANLIMDANPDHIDTLIFSGGVRLRIPLVETRNAPETLAPWRR